MKFKAVIATKWFKPAFGALLTVLCGLLLWRTPLGFWGTPLGEVWENTSYDCLYCFGSRKATNPIVLIRMDEESRIPLKLDPGQLYPRKRQAQLLNKLAEDKSSVVVFDVCFEGEKDKETDKLLADAIRAHGQVILMADIRGEQQDDFALEGYTPILPHTNFLVAAAGCGIGHADPNTLGTARRHWPFSGPGEGHLQSLGWAAAKVYLAKNNSQVELNSKIEHPWLRYYGRYGPCETVSFYQALTKTNGFFRDKIVFIGGWPAKPDDPGASQPDNDKFSTPYTRWHGKAVGGVEIMATTFLNLINGDWLRRPAPWIEALLLVVTGVLLGGTLCRLRPLRCCLVAAAIALIVMLGFVSWSYFTNYWFPWLVIAGGQVPCAVAWTLLAPKDIWAEGRFPGYEVIGEHFGEGAYGKVWLVRNVLGHRQALKEINRSTFDHGDPYDREFRGITNYKPISNLHLGLLHIDHVNRNDDEGYFYYVMELGDAVDPEWEQKGERYKARNLHNTCSCAEGNRLPLGECVRISIALLEGLDFLHQQGFVHRDIKPSNVVFVKGCPKLADVGLVRSFSPEATQVGTLPYMAPEGPGKAPADIYALGKLLYVISTGKKAEAFSEISASLVETPGFMCLNEIFCKACQPASDQRYATAAEMLAALRAAQRELDADHTRQI